MPTERITHNGDKIKYRKVHLNLKKKMQFTGGDQTLAQTVQRGCGVSSLGDTQNLMECGPEQLAVLDPDCARLD